MSWRLFLKYSVIFVLVGLCYNALPVVGQAQSTLRSENTTVALESLSRSAPSLRHFMQRSVASEPTIVVNTLLDDPRGCPDRCTLRNAVATANSGDVIGFSEGLAGTIVLAQPLVIDKDLTIVGNGADALALDGQGKIQILTITQGTVGIYDLTIQNGFLEGYQESGSAIFNNGSLTLTRVTLQDNMAWDGGGIYSNGPLFIVESYFANNRARDSGGAIRQNSGEFTILDSTFSSNYADNSGGAVSGGSTIVTIDNSFFEQNSSDGSGGAATLGGETLIITNTLFEENFSNDGAALNLVSRNFTISQSQFYLNRTVDNPDIQGLGAGAILNGGSGLIDNSEFIGNMGGFGGALENDKNATVEIVDCRFTANISPESGGAIYNQGYLTIERSSFDDNRAHKGAAIAYTTFNDSYIAISLSTFFRNTADFRGGALMFSNTSSRDNTSLFVTSSTFIQNSAVEGDGIFVGEHTYSENASVQLTNTILANGSVDSTGDVVGKFVSLGNNLIGNTTGSIGGWFASDLQNVSPQIDQLCLNDNILFLPLLETSPAIDAGYCEEVADQLGTERQQVCDIGALEYGALPANAMCQSINEVGVLSLPDGNLGDFEFLTPTLLPSPTPTATLTPTATATLQVGGQISHTVQSGESLEAIADAYGVPVDDILALNGLTRDQARFLTIGQVLIIREASPVITPTEFGTLEPTPTDNSIWISVENMGDLASERVVLRNDGQTVRMDNWALSDTDGNVFVFSEFSLFSSATVTVHTRAGSNTPINLFWGKNAAIFEAGDIITLRDANGVLRAVLRL